jgi:hypothetical protein
MYIGAAQQCPHAVALATSIGLFVEPDWPSPQLVIDGEES